MVTVPAFPLAVARLLLDISALLAKVSIPTFTVMSRAMRAPLVSTVTVPPVMFMVDEVSAMLPMPDVGPSVTSAAFTSFTEAEIVAPLSVKLVASTVMLPPRPCWATRA